MNKGIIDRFRSLPMARSAVLTGRTLSDVVYNAGILIVLMLSGLAVGWRVHTGIAGVPRRRRAAAAVRVRDVLDRRLARPVRADRRGRPAGRLHGRSSRSRSSRTSSCRTRPARLGSSRSPSGTRSSTLTAVDARAVRATRTRSRLPGHGPAGRGAGAGDAPVGRWSILAIFVPLSGQEVPLGQPLTI